MPAWRKDVWQQTFWNYLRFAVFLFWLLLIYPTLEADKIAYFTISYDSISFPSLESAWASLRNVWRQFLWSERWHFVAIAGALLWRYRIIPIAFLVVVIAGLAWLLGMSMYNVQRARHFFVFGAILAILYGCGLAGLLFVGEEALSRLHKPSVPPRLRTLLVTCALLILLAIGLRRSYLKSDALEA